MNSEISDLKVQYVSWLRTYYQYEDSKIEDAPALADLSDMIADFSCDGKAEDIASLIIISLSVSLSLAKLSGISFDELDNQVFSPTIMKAFEDGDFLDG